MISLIIVSGISLVVGFVVGWYWRKVTDARAARKLTSDFIKLHAIADQLADVVARMDCEAVCTALDEMLTEEGRDMLTEYLDERGEGL